MKKIIILLLFIVLFSAFTTISGAESFTENIRLNQLGFYPNAPKEAIVIDSHGGLFYITSPDFSDTVYTGSLGAEKVWEYSDEAVRIADFSALKETGTFIVLVPGLGYSWKFEIKPFVFQRVARAVLKGFYYQRASMELEEEFAYIWKRPLGHPDTLVYVHASAATEYRPENTIISCPKGWYDAGDYNKYIVNSGITTYTLLALYEHFPEYCKILESSIPESKGPIPDLLAEALWNIRWMLTMQDPEDGGVYHKLTCTNFQGFTMPHRLTAKRYVVQKSTTATLNFAAVMAQTARIFREYDTEMPGFAESCLTAAISAWNWAQINPDIFYRQSEINSLYSPTINTGEYGDSHPEDEMDWAAMELYITTKQDSFLTCRNIFSDSYTSVPAWPSVRTLGFYSLAFYAGKLSAAVDTTEVKNRLIGLADDLVTSKNNSAYDVVMGVSGSDFVWGSNAITANQGVALLQAFRLTADSTYLFAALSNLDYLLGRNATSYSFVTGYGDKTPMRIHHRQSGSDGIREPVPGLLAGGPNKDQQDNVSYPSDLPAKSYVDNQNSYASNEIAINWNAPLVYLTWVIEAVMSQDGIPNLTAIEEQNNNNSPADYLLMQNYPNPFNPETVISYTLPKAAYISIDIYNSIGQKIITLEDGYKTAGYHQIVWQGLNANGQAVGSGIYLYRLRSDSGQIVKKMLLLR
ncbi:glycoside hydrolase family 9 protein [candidate division KSB1 bacterium]|nr:glycoside hydrolase family 9 protein [candidate division KSB1 bacterium]